MAIRIETVLVGTSLSEASDDVVRQGLDLARAAGAGVALVHAFSTPLVSGSSPWVPELSAKTLERAERVRLRAALEDQAERLGIRLEELASIRLEMGPPHRVLIDAARLVGADLIVVGATESPRLARVFGSTADRVVRKATCPVLVLRDELAIPPARVLLPVDLSPLSADAMRWGLDALGQIAEVDELDLEALYVVTEVQLEAADHRQVTRREVEEMADRRLQRFLARHGTGRRIARRVTSGFVDRAVLGRIQSFRPDLVVLGTHGAGGFERFLLGSVAESVVRHSDASIIVVPPETALGESLAIEAKARVMAC